MASYQQRRAVVGIHRCTINIIPKKSNLILNGLLTRLKSSPVIRAIHFCHNRFNIRYLSLGNNDNNGQLLRRNNRQKPVVLEIVQQGNQVLAALAVTFESIESQSWVHEQGTTHAQSFVRVLHQRVYEIGTQKNGIFTQTLYIFLEAVNYHTKITKKS